MGKNGGNSWLNAVKKAFRSPMKENEKRSIRRREENEQEDEEKVNRQRLPTLQCIQLYICVLVFVTSCCTEICGGFLQKRGKRMWIFRKPSGTQETTIQHNEAKNFRTSANTSMTVGAETLPKNPMPRATDDKQRQAIAVAMATTAAAEAAVATAQAAVEIIRLTGPSILGRKHLAAIAIQTAFRGYLVKSFLALLIQRLVCLVAVFRFSFT